jgi:hypothetical protein
MQDKRLYFRPKFGTQICTDFGTQSHWLTKEASLKSLVHC